MSEIKKTAIITGGSRGIGAETAKKLADCGYNVVINYNASESAAKTLLKDIRAKGNSAIALKCDVSSSSEVKKLFSDAFSEFGSIDILVNNAGIAKQQLITDVTDSDYDKIMGINLGGVFKCCREAVPYMLKSHSGSIINISSIWGISGASCEAVYSASKAGVIGLTKALAKELGPSGIRVNCVAPGVIETDMNSQLSGETLNELKEETPLLRLGKPIDVANAVAFFASEASEFITGQVLSVDGGFIV